MLTPARPAMALVLTEANPLPPNTSVAASRIASTVACERRCCGLFRGARTAFIAMQRLLRLNAGYFPCARQECVNHNFASRPARFRETAHEPAFCRPIRLARRPPHLRAHGGDVSD